MNGLEGTLLYGASGAAGLIAEQNIVIPFTTGNAIADNGINILVGVAAVVLGLHIDGEIGKLTALAGAGWTLGAGLSAIGY